MKTLEYMEQRAKKGREIAERIEKLRKYIEKVVETRVVHFRDHGNSFMFDSSVGNLTAKMKQAYIEAATEEIARLERELAEL